MFNWQFLRDTFFTCLKALPLTLEITFISMLVSSIFGFLLALLRMKERPVSKRIIGVYISLIRGTPTIVQILVIYSVLPSIISAVCKALHIGLDIYSVPPILYAYIVFILNTTAIMTEVFRSGLMTVDKGQLEAAECAGLTKPMAYIRIVLPQAFVAVLPNMCTITTNLLKSTSLAFVMSIKDVTAVAKIEAAKGYNYMEAYVDVLIIYIIVCIIIEQAFKFVERRLKKHRGQKIVRGGRHGKTA